MRYTIEQYERLKEQIAKGVRTVAYGDKSVTHMTLDEMLKVQKMMEEELFPERFFRRRRFAEVDKGFNP